ncbi:LysR family transcriptional regulator [Stappia sp. F7233]|uniref:LysR family transcriptional regulator n=1 Tax=Stappia albiluteola TaxID=2758565 RepID=A0A839AEL6_9HYPH|nr:LysR family transcriptional regulator [Stappia albiluteola]MBA5778260.1 LysR family transcriptional regulator [Stappia albiluteola]
MLLSGSDLRLLRVFDAVVRNGGFAAAEVELNLSQSTISNHMSALEQRLGVTLCQRGRKGFRLTAQGRAVYEAARRLDKAVHDFSADIGSVRGELSGELRIGVLDAIAEDRENHLPKAIGLFRKTAANVRLTIAQERAQELQQRVRDGVYHCGIGVKLNRVDGLDELPLYEEHHGLYCGRGHPLFDVPDDAVTKELVGSFPFVQRGYWRDEEARRHALGPVAATVYQIEPQLMLLKSGEFTGFLPRHYAERWVAAGDLRHLAPTLFGYRSTFCLFTAKGARKTDVVTAFVEAAKAVWAVRN